MKLIKGLQNKILDLNGKELTNTKDLFKDYISLALATMRNCQNPASAYKLAVDIKGVTLDEFKLEAPDYELVRQALLTAERLSPLVTGQIIAKCLDKAEEFDPNKEKPKLDKKD